MTPPHSPLLCRIFEDDRSGLVARLCQEEIQPSLLSVSPESRKVRFAGPDKEEGEDELEGEVLIEDNSHHLQVEKSASFISEVVSEQSVVDVDQDNEEQGLVESDHIVVSSPLDGQLPLLPVHPYGHRKTEHQSAGFHPKVSISYQIRVLIKSLFLVLFQDDSLYLNKLMTGQQILWCLNQLALKGSVVCIVH